MHLYSRILGTGPPVVILHGLLGMSDNWMSVGRALAQAGFSVHLLDLRNHGRSPHADCHRYTDMTDDLLGYLMIHDLDQASIVGHSMGGKLAMIFALLNPEKVRRLALIDIAPVDYRKPGNTYHEQLLTTLLGIDLSSHSSLKSIHEEIARRLGDGQLAMFLAKNITKTSPRGAYGWRCNLPVLQRHIRHLLIGLADLEAYGPCLVPSLFLKGNQSSYVLPEHETERLHFFPQSHLLGIDGAGHWLHSDQPQATVAALLAFLGVKP
jgi:pimeloyl-ACP methyl ester carboxylesterase